MKFQEFTPSAVLANFVNCYWLMTNSDNLVDNNSEKDRLIPDGSLEIVFHLKKRIVKTTFDGEEFFETSDMIIGQVTKPYFIHPEGEVYIIGIRFFPHTIHYFLDFPVQEINDTALTLDLVWGEEYRILKNNIISAQNIQQSIDLIESFLIKKLENLSYNFSHKALDYCYKSIMLTNGKCPIEKISKELGISNRYLQRICLEKMGISPKYFAKIIRFQHIFNHLLNNQNRTWTSISYELGYYDQAHFIKDFRLFTGTNPSSYIKEKHPIISHFTNPKNRSYLYNFGY